MKFLFSFLLVFITSVSIAQNHFIDSLVSVLKTAKEDTNKVNTLNVLSLKLAGLGQLDTALYFTGLSKVAAEKIDFKKGVANSMHIVGVIYLSAGDYPVALKSFSTSLKIREGINDKFGMANSYNNIGNVYFSTGDLPSAKTNFNAALKIYEEINNKAGIAGCYNSFGNFYTNQGNYQEALKNFNSAQKQFEDIGNKIGLIKCYSNKGVVNQYLGNYNESLKEHALALKMRVELGDKAGIVLSHQNIGFNYVFLSRFNEALTEFSMALKLYEELKDKKGIATIYNNIGAVYSEQSDYENALKIHFKGLKMKESIGDKFGITDSYINVGNVYLIQGKYPEALKSFNTCLKISQEIGYKKNISDAYSSIGLVYLFQGNNALALQNFVQSLTIKKEIGTKIGLSESYNNIGNLFLAQGNYEEALKNLSTSLNILIEIDNKKGMSLNYNNIGSVYRDQGKYDEALKNFDLAFKIRETIGDKNGMGSTYINVGEVYRLQKKNKEALSSFLLGSKIGEEIGDSRMQSIAYLNIGLLMLQMGNLNEAKINGNLSLELARELDAPDLIKNSESLLSKIYIKENNLQAAEKFELDILELNNKKVVMNFPILSEKEQELYFNTLSMDYMAFNSFALIRKKENPAITESVYNTAVRNKGLLLKSSTAMRNAILNSSDTALINKYKDWLVLKKQISKVYSEGKEASELEEKANVLEKELVKNSQIFNDFNKVLNLNWKDVQKSLKPGEVAIEFINFNHQSITDSLSQNVYCAVVIKPDSRHPEMIELFESRRLENILGKYRQNDELYVNNVYGTNDQPKTELYNLIWQPLESILKNAKTVYLSPSGLLHKISFASLCKAKNIYLCDNYNLKIQTSTAKVVFPEKFIFNEKTSVAIFGGIDYNSTIAPSDSNSYLTWNYLSGTKSEAEKITTTLKQNKIRTDFYADKSATEGEFKKAAFDNSILHIATHGFFFPDPEEIKKAEKNQEQKNQEDKKALQPLDLASRNADYGFGVWSFVMNKNSLMRSGLVFAGANGVWNQEEQTEAEDGVLTAQEVANIDMRKTGLAVLSACETGLGDIKGSEGVYGLQRSFKMAGVKFIIMSLWQVPDAETEEFMALFYNKLVANKNVKVAFSETQKVMRKKYDPFYWAPFVLIE
ncbi:MAG: CHAT domain-containing protein [Bacteroidetes bacterium]|nr:CHAT domain-containing protein [Bacteroidota bacterium]